MPAAPGWPQSRAGDDGTLLETGDRISRRRSPTPLSPDRETLGHPRRSQCFPRFLCCGLICASLQNQRQRRLKARFRGESGLSEGYLVRRRRGPQNLASRHTRQNSRHTRENRHPQDALPRRRPRRDNPPLPGSGGGAGNRTPVREAVLAGRYERIPHFIFARASPTGRICPR